MSIKLTESKIESLIDTLNSIICDEVNITREQRENMVRTVATLGALNERHRLIAAEKEAKKQTKKNLVSLIWYSLAPVKRGCKKTLILFTPLLMISLTKVLTTTFCGFQSSRDVHPML